MTILEARERRPASRPASGADQIERRMLDGGAIELVTRTEDRVREELARELHDSVAQILTQMLVEMENFKVDQVGRESVLRSLDLFQSSTREVLSEMRALLYRLRGEEAASVDLKREAQVLVRDFRIRTRLKITLRFYGAWPARVSRTIALNLLKVLQEAMSNAHRHSGTTSIAITFRPGRNQDLVLIVRDRGIGMGHQLRKLQGLGLVGMRERVLSLGGELQVDSSPGSGSTIRVLIPRERVQ